MTDKEIRHLSKTELLSIIRDQEQELQQAREQAEEWKRQLEDKQIRLEKCGSIAEASLQIQKVFETAQAAADQYLSEVRKKRDGAEAESQRILAEARQKADAQLRASAETGKVLEEDGRRKAGVYWTALQDRLEAFYQSHQGLEKMLASCGMTIQIPTTGVKREDDGTKGAAPQP
jgi:membrane protein involved in colicin uptake